MFQYHNANPKNMNIADCTIRALSVAEDITWQEAYDLLSSNARDLGRMQSDIIAIESFLDKHYIPVSTNARSVGEFIDQHQEGVYLITMPNHITALKDGVNYDTFDCSHNTLWGAWLVK